MEGLGLVKRLKRKRRLCEAVLARIAQVTDGASTLGLDQGQNLT